MFIQVILNRRKKDYMNKYFQETNLIINKLFNFKVRKLNFNKKLNNLKL